MPTSNQGISEVHVPAHPTCNLSVSRCGLQRAEATPASPDQSAKSGDSSQVTKVVSPGTQGPFPNQGGRHSILAREKMLMDRGEIIRDGLLSTLAERYESDRSQYVTLPMQTLDSSLARVVVAELRNEGHVEEQMRGVIRLTLRGYQSYRNPPFATLKSTESQAYGRR